MEVPGDNNEWQRLCDETSSISASSGRTLMLGKDESVAIWVEQTMRVNNAGALAAAALVGAGYAVGVPLWQISSHLKTGKLELVLENWRIAARPVWLLKHPHIEHNTIFAAWNNI